MVRTRLVSLGVFDRRLSAVFSNLHITFRAIRANEPLTTNTKVLIWGLRSPGSLAPCIIFGIPLA